MKLVSFLTIMMMMLTSFAFVNPTSRQTSPKILGSRYGFFPNLPTAHEDTLISSSSSTLYKSVALLANSMLDLVSHIIVQIDSQWKSLNRRNEKINKPTIVLKSDYMNQTIKGLQEIYQTPNISFVKQFDFNTIPVVIGVDIPPLVQLPTTSEEEQTVWTTELSLPSEYTFEPYCVSTPITKDVLIEESIAELTTFFNTQYLNKPEWLVLVDIIVQQLEMLIKQITYDTRSFVKTSSIEIYNYLYVMKQQLRTIGWDINTKVQQIQSIIKKKFHDIRFSYIIEMVEMVDHWIDMIVGYFRWILQNGLSYLTDKAIFFKQLHSQYFIDTVLIYLLVGKLLGNCVQNRTKVSESTLENVMLLESEYTTLKGLIQVLSKKSRNDDETIQSLQTNIEELSSDCEKLKKERKKIQQDSAKILMKCIILDKKVKRYELFYDTYMKGKTNTSDRLRRFSITQ